MLELCVCIGNSCRAKGSYNLIRTLHLLIEDQSLYDRINFRTSFCKHECQLAGIAVAINDTIHEVTEENAKDFFEVHILSKV